VNFARSKGLHLQYSKEGTWKNGMGIERREEDGRRGEGERRESNKEDGRRNG